jgi:signal peptidase
MPTSTPAVNLLPRAGTSTAAQPWRPGHTEEASSGWPRDIATSLAAVLLAVLCGLVLWSLLPTALGWKPQVVLTGSMYPRIHPGDLVLAAPVTAAAVQPGQVMLFQDPAHPARTLVHRVVRRDPDGDFITKGDANQSEDSTPVPPGNVRGLPRLRIPWIGLPVVWIKTHQTGRLLGFGLLFTLAALLVIPATPTRQFTGWLVPPT